MQAQPADQPAANDDSYLEVGVDEIIADHGGDARKAVRSLLEQVAYLEAARDRALVLVSYGFVRGNAAHGEPC